MAEQNAAEIVLHGLNTVVDRLDGLRSFLNSNPPANLALFTGTGGDVHKWLRALNRQFLLNPLQDAARNTVALATTDSRAFEFLERYLTDNQASTWTETKNALALEFGVRESVYTKNARLTSLKQSAKETVSQFGYRIITQGEAVFGKPLPDRLGIQIQLLTIFMQGMANGAIRKVVRRANPTTLTEAINVARTEFDIMRDLGELPGMDGRDIQPMDVDNVARAAVRPINRIGTNQKQRTYQGPSDRGIDRRPWTAPRAPMADNRRDVQCWLCGKHGHIQRFCPIHARRQRGCLQTIEGLPANDTRYASALTEMARPDTCSPRLTTVEIPKPKEYNHFFWPTCTRVKRCGGCAGDDSLKCVPTANGKINQKVHVVRVVFPYPGASSFEWNGINAIELEAHKECKEVCKISEADCRDELHIYSEADCSCRCKTSTIAKCSHPKFWDEKTCSCICPKIKACDHGLRFSKKVCMCVHDNRGSKFASANASFIMPNGESKSGSNQVDSNRITNNAKGPSERKNAERNALNSPTSEVPKKGVDLMNLLTTEENSRAAVTRTTTTTVKTTTTTKKVNKCGFKKCPFLWVPVLQRNGICGCKPNFG